VAAGEFGNTLDSLVGTAAKQMRRAMVMARRQLHYEDQRSFFRLMTCERRMDFAMIFTPLPDETMRRTKNRPTESSGSVRITCC
jgi:hypothetical protein